MYIFTYLLKEYDHNGNMAAISRYNTLDEVKQAYVKAKKKRAPTPTVWEYTNGDYVRMLGY